MGDQGTKMEQEEENNNELRRGPWTLDEDTLLIHYISSHGEGRWNLLAKFSGLKRTGKSCRLRWLNYLKPDIKRGKLTPQEQLLILDLHSKWGNRWSRIAQNLPGRTDNEIKNYWRTRVQKQARALNIDSSSDKFHEAVRCFWSPKLIQKMEQDDATCESSSPATKSCHSFHLTTSSSQANASSSSGSMEMEFSQIAEILDHQPSPHDFIKTNYWNSPFSSYDSYSIADINNSVCDLQQFDTNHISFSDLQMAESNWVDHDVWNTDELWQFR